jgi:hypothetical protein
MGAKKKDWLDRLSDLHALMGSTTHEGEAEACRQKIIKLLKKRGRGWHDLPELLAQKHSAGSSSPPSSPPSPPSASLPPADSISALDLFQVARALFQTYVHVQSPHHHVAFALWVMHAYVFRQFRFTPRLLLTSAIEGEGKSTAIDVLEQLVPYPKKYENTTGPTVMREANETPTPTFLLDEADNLNLLKDPLFRSVLNAGYKRGGKRSITVKGKATTYSLFSPMTLGCISILPGPLMRRSIVIAMKRATNAEKQNLRQFDEEDPDQKREFDIVREQLAIWARTYELERYPQMPAQLSSSPADAWRPLIACADACGAEVGQIARKAAIAMSGWGENPKVILLADLRTVFEMPLDQLSKPHPVNTSEQLASATIVAELVTINELWGDWTGENNDQTTRKLNTGIMGKMLRPWIRSVTLWPVPRGEGAKSAKGYRRADLEKLWEIYCPRDDATSPNAGTPSQVSNVRYLRGVGST